MRRALARSLGAWSRDKLVMSLFLRVFSLARARRQGQGEPTASPGHALHLLLANSITGVIIVILVQRIGDLDLPFQFAVNDLFGDLIVGLLSFKASQALHDRLFDKVRNTGYAKYEPPRPDRVEIVAARMSHEPASAQDVRPARQ